MLSSIYTFTCWGKLCLYAGRTNPYGLSCNHSSQQLRGKSSVGAVGVSRLNPGLQAALIRERLGGVGNGETCYFPPSSPRSVLASKMPIIKVSRNTSSSFSSPELPHYPFDSLCKAVWGRVEWRSLMSWVPPLPPSHPEGNKQTKKETHFTYLLWRMLLLGMPQNNNNSVNNYCWGYREWLTCRKDRMHSKKILSSRRHWHNLPICVTNLVNGEKHGEFQVTAGRCQTALDLWNVPPDKVPLCPPTHFHSFFKLVPPSLFPFWETFRVLWTCRVNDFLAVYLWEPAYLYDTLALYLLRP